MRASISGDGRFCARTSGADAERLHRRRFLTRQMLRPMLESLARLKSSEHGRALVRAEIERVSRGQIGLARFLISCTQNKQCRPRTIVTGELPPSFSGLNRQQLP